MKYHTSKFDLSVWVIHLSTYFYHTVRFTTNLFNIITKIKIKPNTCSIYIYKYIYNKNEDQT